LKVARFVIWIKVLAAKLAQHPAERRRTKLMKVSSSDFIHKNTSKNSIWSYQGRNKPIEDSLNTSFFEESADQIAPTGEVCAALAQAGDGFAMSFRVIWKLRLLKLGTY
jgi:hypothetical protein